MARIDEPAVRFTGKSKRHSSHSVEDQQPASKKAKPTIVSAASLTKPEQKQNEDNDPYWEISSKRRVTIQKYKGTTLVALREYYEKDGRTLPGKQGISLTIEQFTAFLSALPDIKADLAKRGHDIDGSPDAKSRDDDKEASDG